MQQGEKTGSSVRRLLVLVGLTLALTTGCGQASAELDSSAAPRQTWEELRASAYVEQDEDGSALVVDGDTSFPDEAALRQFYDETVSTEDTRALSQGLAIYHLNGADVKWGPVRRRNLTYCVKRVAFGARYAEVVSAMNAAAAAWEAAAGVDFVHSAAQDDNCTATNTNVVFNVIPAPESAGYLAAAFFPNYARIDRRLRIHSSAFGPFEGPSAKLSLVGILRHELGHALGFRHEHTRPAARACYEDANFRNLTVYDSASVMHYPQCNGTGDWSLTLTALDIQGAAKVYPR